MEVVAEGDPKQTLNRRVKGVTVERPLIFGNLAWWQGKKADPAHTHKWTAFVRGPQNEDISYFVKKIVFYLHESFERPKRVVTHHPFEVSATGYVSPLLLFLFDDLILKKKKKKKKFGVSLSFSSKSTLWMPQKDP